MVEERPAKRARNGSPADDSADFNVSMEDIFGEEDVNVTQSGLDKAWISDETSTFVRVFHLVFPHPSMASFTGPAPFHLDKSWSGPS